ncbi:transcription elongation factor GreA [Mycoplasmopsis verecunda]|uniref:Transcription elongation factor GreA n=1 Tax=Mycoplasmopsis verecunda TaxID=171291 RepID=A0A1T4L9I0_9BACT|nr:transcription elongation factor GreA [Mycoplasmopsis verecunda]WPB54476.1 transcription elongation factor GreA [Mycoplasmopsis verecunda]SJZ51399.1 transcription elongation factor GreA [Mycoplasmopsis verecunda]
MSNNEQLRKVYLSQETLDKYKKEYEYLINVERPAVQAALKEARAQGDLSENAEYDAARDKQGAIEGRISELEQIIDNAVLIEGNERQQAQEVVTIGSTVEFTVEATGERKRVTIMGVHDADPFDGKISNKSPLAVAMLGQKVGAVVEVNTATKYNIQINSVEFSV